VGAYRPHTPCCSSAARANCRAAVAGAQNRAIRVPQGEQHRFPSARGHEPFPDHASRGARGPRPSPCVLEKQGSSLEEIAHAHSLQKTGPIQTTSALGHGRRPEREGVEAEFVVSRAV
jgi:hypothetical protein